MTTGFNTAATGMIWQQKALDVTANNVSNVSTEGYQADKASFADLLYTNVKAEEGNSALKVGHGAKLSKTDTLYESGGLSQTGRTLDYALTDARNFFAVRASDGTVQYTRDGRFEWSRQNDGRFYLANTSGSLVLDRNNRPIAQTGANAPVNVGVFTFRNLDGLVKTGSNGYAPTARSGGAQAVPGAEVKGGYLENSAVDLATELSNMIVQQRSYEMDARMVQMSDEVMQTVNNLR